ncbi:hypothetical protein [Paenibacillus terrigena]|uniref:hypothetical protein n=1 Tax=Paenibacillus terrigena TaxID=369333 RepID=UPI0028D8FF13|nr:hypothetical protein [Paenibacillus terrigena]
MSDQSRKAVQDAIQADFDSMNAATSASAGLTSMQFGRDDVQEGNAIPSATPAAPDASMQHASNVIEDDDYI